MWKPDAITQASLKKLSPEALSAAALKSLAILWQADTVARTDRRCTTGFFKKCPGQVFEVVRAQSTFYRCTTCQKTWS